MNDAKQWRESVANEIHDAVRAANGNISYGAITDALFAKVPVLAAAPDLLEACEASLWAVNAAECLGEKEGIGKDTTKYPERIKLDAIVERVRAAIAKAEGK